MKRLREEHEYSSIRKKRFVAFNYGSLKKHNRIIFAGLFPPAKSHKDRQHHNITSNAVINELGHTNFDWIDLYPVCSDMHSKDITIGEITSQIQSRFLFLGWVMRIKNRTREIHDNKHTPIIYICGNICKHYWRKVYELQENHEEVISQQLRIYWNFDLQAIVIYGPHPSSHLTSHGNAKHIQVFEKFMQVLNGVYVLHGGNGGKRVGAKESIKESLRLFEGEFALWEHKNKLQSVKVAQSVFGRDSFPEFYTHLDTCNYHLSPFIEPTLQKLDRWNLLHLCQRKTFTKNIFQHCHHVKFIEQLSALLTSIQLRAVTANGSFNRYLHKSEFQSFVLQLLENFERKLVCYLLAMSHFCMMAAANKAFRHEFWSITKTCSNFYYVYQLFKNSAFCFQIVNAGFKREFLAFCSTFEWNIITFLFSSPEFCQGIVTQQFVHVFQVCLQYVKVNAAACIMTSKHILNQIFPSSFTDTKVVEVDFEFLYKVTNFLSKSKTKNNYLLLLHHGFAIPFVERRLWEKVGWLETIFGTECCEKALFRNVSFISNMAKEELYDHMMSWIQFLRKYCRDEEEAIRNVGAIFQSSTFVVRVMRDTMDLQKKFNDLLKHFSLEIVVLLFSVSTFLTKMEQYPSKMIQRLHTICDFFKSDQVLILLSCSAFIHRIPVDNFYEFFWLTCITKTQQEVTKCFGDNAFCISLYSERRHINLFQ